MQHLKPLYKLSTLYANSFNFLALKFPYYFFLLYVILALFLVLIVVLYIRREGSWKDNYIAAVLQGHKISQHYKGTHGIGIMPFYLYFEINILLPLSPPFLLVSYFFFYNGLYSLVFSSLVVSFHVMFHNMFCSIWV